MRHLKKGRKFSRERDQRKALLKGLLEALILHEKVKTTLARAKELKPLIEKKVSVAKNKSLSNIRLLRKSLSEKSVKKLINEIAPRFSLVAGGYVRIVKLTPRKTDGAKMAIIQFVK